MKYTEKYPEALILKIEYIDGKVRVRERCISAGKCPLQLEYSTGGWGVYGETQKIRGWTIRIDGTAYMTDPTGESQYLSIGGSIEGLRTALKIASIYNSFMEARKKEHLPF